MWTRPYIVRFFASLITDSVRNLLIYISPPIIFPQSRNLLKSDIMKEKEIKTSYKEYSFDELPPEERHLVEKAKEMTRKSYAPWSKFMVGAAILLDNGEIVCGANQENVAFPSGTCAERSACYYAGANHPGVPLRKIAIAARNLSKDETLGFEESFEKTPVAPCGACRQALIEYERLYGPIEVILYGADSTYVIPSVSALMPFTFIDF